MQDKIHIFCRIFICIQDSHILHRYTHIIVIIASDCSLDKEFSSRVSKVAHSFDSLSRELRFQREVMVKTKINIFKSVVIPTLL